MKRIITICAAILMTASVFAQSPEKMSYQAVVRDGNNALVTSSSVGMQISILQGSVTGTTVYSETQTPTSNANGLVSIEIGDGSVVSGDFSTIDWAEGPYFIQTETDPNGGTNYTVTGTSQLLSVPYALHAKNTDSWSVEADTIFTSKRVGVGTDSPDFGLSLVGDSYRKGSLEIKRVNGPSALRLRRVNNSFLNPNPILSGTPISLIEFSGYDGGLNFPDGTSMILARATQDYTDIENGTLLEFWTTPDFQDTRVKQLEIDQDGSLKVKNNDVYLENIGSGVIMKSPNGSCWRVTVDNTGNFVSTAITCP